jgi:hypothetical protein
MALSTAMKNAIRRVVQILRAYATAQGWHPGEYQIYIRPNEGWGRIEVILVAREFPGKDYFEQWESVINFLEKELKHDRPLFEALNLVLHTFDQVAEGGLYAIGSGYEEVDDLLTGRPATGD